MAKTPWFRIIVFTVIVATIAFGMIMLSEDICEQIVAHGQECTIRNRWQNVSQDKAVLSVLIAVSAGIGAMATFLILMIINQINTANSDKKDA